MKRVVCMIIGHKWAHIRTTGSLSSRDFYNKCVRCGRVDDDPPTSTAAGG